MPKAKKMRIPPAVWAKLEGTESASVYRQEDLHIYILLLTEHALACTEESLVLQDERDHRRRTPTPADHGRIWRALVGRKEEGPPKEDDNIMEHGVVAEEAEVRHYDQLGVERRRNEGTGLLAGYAAQGRVVVNLQRGREAREPKESLLRPQTERRRRNIERTRRTKRGVQHPVRRGVVFAPPECVQARRRSRQSSKRWRRAGPGTRGRLVVDRAYR